MFVYARNLCECWLPRHSSRTASARGLSRPAGARHGGCAATAKAITATEKQKNST